MEQLALEIFDLATKDNPKPTTSKYANLEPDQSITITDTNEIFASGDVWSHSFTLNVHANSHIFGTSGDLHGSRLHEQINKRRARLWVMGLPLYLGYLKLDDEAEVDAEGNVDVSFESGQKTFEEMIEGTNAREVSVGNVPIGIALNRQREGEGRLGTINFYLEGLAAYANKDTRLYKVDGAYAVSPELTIDTPYLQRWPKIVKSHGKVYDENWNTYGSAVDDNGNNIIDYTNVQTPYDDGHPFCNINICYQMKTNKNGEEISGRGYTVRLAHGKPTTDGGDNETRYNNAPNFYLLHFIDRLFKDLGIHITENQALDVEDLRRLFMLNYGCHYEEIENDGKYYDSHTHSTPDDKKQRYGQYYIPFVNNEGERYLIDSWDSGEIWPIKEDDSVGKVLVRDVVIRDDFNPLLQVGSVEGSVVPYLNSVWVGMKISEDERSHKAYSAYTAYATGDNYPDVEISEIIEAMKSMFGVRLLFSNDFSTVRIVLLRNIFRRQDVQNIDCEIEDADEKTENGIRGFRMTYGQGTEDSAFYYKGFADVFPRKATTWKDTTDKHDYSQWNLNAEYDFIKQYVSAMNKICYVTPVNGNAYATKVDEEEDVLFPSLFEMAGYMDAEDGDCSGDSETIHEVQAGAAPVIMSEVGSTYASLFGGELKAPSPDDDNYAQKIATFGRVTTSSIPWNGRTPRNQYVSGKLDIYLKEGFKIRMEDNYGIGNSGTPFDEASPGLRFGIMRSSGSDAFIRYSDDFEDREGNETWDIEPGVEAISHPDTCNNYGDLWDYDGQMYIGTSEDAKAALQSIFPDSNAAFDDDEMGYVEETTYAFVEDNQGIVHYISFASKYSNGPRNMDICWYADEFLRGQQTDAMLSIDRDNRSIIIEIDGSFDRRMTFLLLESKAYGGLDWKLYIDPDGVGSLYGRFSLKLRAEKPNPYYVASLPEIVRTKQEAGAAMTKLYTTSDTNLLTRPKVPNATMRTAGWDCPGDGYATVYSQGYSVQYQDGSLHEILWSPIKQDGAVLTAAQLQTYVSQFDGMVYSQIKSSDTMHLILDIDTTELRAEKLHELQALYYAEDGEPIEPVDITPINKRYLEIDNPNLRGRGLCDQFYKEYSYWIRNARIVKRTVHMELAQLLSIDKTKRVRVGDVTGFIRKMQYTVSNKTGLGEVTMEIMYI